MSMTGCVEIERCPCGDGAVNETSLKARLEERATWNLWANKELAKWLGTLTWSHDLAGSAYLILHGEDFWLARMQGRDGLYAHDGAYSGSTPALLRSLVAQSGRLASYARAVPESSLLEMRALDDAAAGHCRLSRAEMFRQAFRDSAHHRGRILAHARSLQLGEPPMAAYLEYPAHRAC
jgi:uncharacterized damage-inducible protein DinB